jgi:hydroxymethylbilane synthase
LVQSEGMAEALREANPGLEVAIEIIHTKGDKILDVPLAQIGGKGLFTKELEVALLDGRVDLAVHSLKDLPTDFPDGLMLGAVPAREIPYDAFVCAKWDHLDDMPAGAKVGTSSLRRQAQVLARRPDLRVVDLRGNVETRVRKVQEGIVDAAVLACAGLERLGLFEAIRARLTEDIMISAPAQGALGLEIRSNDEETARILESVADPTATVEVTAERSCLAALEGGCQVPIGALARLSGTKLRLIACVCSLDGTTVLRTECEGHASEAINLGRLAAERLLDQGASELIAATR